MPVKRREIEEGVAGVAEKLGSVVSFARVLRGAFVMNSPRIWGDFHSSLNFRQPRITNSRHIKPRNRRRQITIQPRPANNPPSSDWMEKLRNKGTCLIPGGGIVKFGKACGGNRAEKEMTGKEQTLRK